MSIVEGAALEPMVGDPDDHRPASRWGLKVDPGDDSGRVESMAIITEQIAVGDGIPLHTHDVDEAITILAGTADARLGTERRRIGPGAIVFVPAGTPHGTANAGEDPLQIHAGFRHKSSRSPCWNAIRRPEPSRTPRADRGMTSGPDPSNTCRPRDEDDQGSRCCMPCSTS